MLRNFVRKRLRELGLTATEAERNGNLVKGFIGDILRGTKRNVSGHNVARLAAALGCDPAEVLKASFVVSPHNPRAETTELVPSSAPAEEKSEQPFPDAIPEADARIGDGDHVDATPKGEGLQPKSVRNWWGIPDEIAHRVLRCDHDGLIVMPVIGSAMEPEIMRSDYALIDTSERSLGAEGVYAIDVGAGVILRRLFAQRNAHGTTYLLRAVNPKFPDETLRPEEITVIGRYKGRFTCY